MKESASNRSAHRIRNARRATIGALPLVLSLQVACAVEANDAPPAQSTSEEELVDLEPQVRWGMVMHGGAGTILRENMTPELEQEYRAKLEEALRAGHAVLSRGGASLDAVTAAINVLEDSPLFNAGKGAVFTAEGTHTLDSSIMDGATGMAGAVAGVTDVKNPINLARAVMEHSPHVLLSGAGAETFARLQGIPSTPRDYFDTDRRRQQLEDAQAAEAAAGGGGGGAAFNTVGAIALDQAGNLAAGTSTGGMTNKKWGRIGDSPIVGAGTFAGPGCAISGTGWGEYYIRNVVAYDICARVKYTGVSIVAAAQAVIDELEAQEPDTGGVIAMDGQGHIATPFNTSGMYRGWIDQNGNVTVHIYADEEDR